MKRIKIGGIIFLSAILAISTFFIESRSNITVASAMASKTVDKSEEVLEIDDSHYLYDDLHLSRDTMQDILDFAGYRVVFDDTKKAPHKAVLNGMWQRPILPVRS